MFVPTKPPQHGLILTSKANWKKTERRSTQVGTLVVNIRQCWEGLVGTNALAYSGRSNRDEEKKFYKIDSRVKSETLKAGRVPKGGFSLSFSPSGH